MSLYVFRKYPRVAWVVVVAVLVILDQLTKAYFASAIALGDSIPVTAWFNLVHTLNEGAAFSFLADAGGWQRIFLITVGILVVVPVAILCQTSWASPVDRWLGGCVVAGGTGNLIDRIQMGAVVDFLDFHWESLHWPAFNLADIYVVSAVTIWGLTSFRKSAPLSPEMAQPKVKP